MHAFMIELDDKPGALATVTEAIAAKGVNVTGISGATCGEKGRLAVVTDDNAKTMAALGDIQCTFEQKEITETTLRQEPGTLAKAARQLANAGVNIEAIMPMGMNDEGVQVGFVTSDPVKARNALAHAGSASR